MYFEKSKSQLHYEKNQLEFVCLDQLVPQDHILRRIENAVNFEFIHDLTKDLYSHTAGRNCLDTVTLFKIVILSFLTGKNSIRATLEDTKVNMAYRWFLNLSLTGNVPNYSTFSKNYSRRYESSDVFDKIFNTILESLIDNNLIDTSIIFVDGTHIKANANKKKFIKKAVNVEFTKFEKQIQKEIKNYRKEIGRNDNDDDDNDENIDIDEETGEVKDIKETKTINISKVDPDSGMYVKGEHERVFAYVDQVGCDKNGYILGFDVNSGNMHDSKAFLPFYEKYLSKLNPNVVCCDAGYNNAFNAKYMIDNNVNLLVPYARPKGGKDLFNNKFTYILECDSYLCPNGNLLHKNNVTKDGYVEYIIEPHNCNNCPFKKDCLKNYKRKTIRRHMYQDCVEVCKNYRLSDEGKEIYSLRKETIERVFADGKEKHGLRYTRFKGLVKNRHLRCLLYACLNIKKVALLLSRRVTNKIKICNI